MDAKIKKLKRFQESFQKIKNLKKFSFICGTFAGVLDQLWIIKHK
ncbi:hypothetical protein LCGC14_1070300 [marine sediment metagenome]|uniref:Uncharacterized protein n=1 Tax=marine sediment metagenome TaxID=412755 RepID=A0A0F9Q1F5_9ZZZZ